MANWLPTNPNSYVLELGPGTGAVTEALLERGLREDRLVTIEHNPKLASHLRKRFPRAVVISGDAWQMVDLLREQQQPIEKVGAVISSLPLLNFPLEQCTKLADQIGALLEKDGKWVQYSYHIGKRPRGSHKFQRVDSKIVWLNIPPARVHVFQK
jgi:phosphatidylethanolamine/phosphatidyl-N-methylethanolamine N-methyltransferase